MWVCFWCVHVKFVWIMATTKRLSRRGVDGDGKIKDGEDGWWVCVLYGAHVRSREAWVCFGVESHIVSAVVVGGGRERKNGVGETPAGGWSIVVVTVGYRSCVAGKGRRGKSPTVVIVEMAGVKEIKAGSLFLLNF